MQPGKRYSRVPGALLEDEKGDWLYDPDGNAVSMAEHCEALKKVVELTVENDMARIVQTVLRRELKRHQAFNEPDVERQIRDGDSAKEPVKPDRRKRDLGTHIHRAGILAAFYDGSIGTLKVRAGDKRGE